MRPAAPGCLCWIGWCRGPDGSPGGLITRRGMCLGDGGEEHRQCGDDLRQVDRQHDSKVTSRSNSSNGGKPVNSFGVAV